MTASFPGSVKSFGADRVNGDYIPASDMNDVRSEIVAIETMALTGGWVNDPNSWTYGSATTFTVAGNQTAIFTKGARVRWKQGGGFRYGIVSSSAFTSQTTVTLVTNTDYPVLNQAITDPGYSYLSDPVGWPGWFAYTPVFTGFSVDPTMAGSYFNIRGSTCYVIHNEATSGTSSGTTFTFTLPVPSGNGANAPLGPTYDNSVQVSSGYLTFAGGGATVCQLLKDAGAGWSPGPGTKRASCEFFYRW